MMKADGRRRWAPRQRPSTHEQIAPTLLFRSALLQSSIMGRADILKRYPYRLEFPVAQDLDMFIRVSRDHRLANLPKTLVDRRFHAGQAVRQRADLIVDRKRALFHDSLARLGIDPSEEDLGRHIVLGRLKGTPVNRYFLDWSRRWLERIITANQETPIYDAAGLAYAVRWVWWRACRTAFRGGDRLHGLAGLLQWPRG